MQPRRHIWASLFLVSFLSTYCVAWQQSAEKLIEAGDRMVDRMEYQEAVENYTLAYMTIVSMIRGQSFQEAVEPTLMTRPELAAEMRKQFDVDYTPEKIQMEEGSYKAFGFIPPTFDLKATMIQLLTEEVAGFYDPRSKAMVLIRGETLAQQPGFLGKLLGEKPTFDKEDQKTTLSHELTHALQDQLYGLKAMQDRIAGDDDMSLAFSALVEGDATLVMFGEMGRQEGNFESVTEMDPEQTKLMFGIMKWMLPVAGGKTYRKAPPLFRDTLVFPYLSGMVFNLHLAREGGFGRIHETYKNPPVSTEQILHPEKYAKDIDMPFAIAIPEIEHAVGSDWKLLGSNCLGELQTSILLKSVPGGGQAAVGWDGDRYYTFQHSNGKLGLVWYTTWDSERDAKEFEQAITRLQAGKDCRVGLRGQDVWMILGFDAQEVAPFEALLQQVEKTEKRFPVESPELASEPKD